MKLNISRLLSGALALASLKSPSASSKSSSQLAELNEGSCPQGWRPSDPVGYGAMCSQQGEVCKPECSSNNACAETECTYDEGYSDPDFEDYHCCWRWKVLNGSEERQNLRGR